MSWLPPKYNLLPSADQWTSHTRGHADTDTIRCAFRLVLKMRIFPSPVLSINAMFSPSRERSQFAKLCPAVSSDHSSLPKPLRGSSTEKTNCWWSLCEATHKVDGASAQPRAKRPSSNPLVGPPLKGMRISEKNQLRQVKSIKEGKQAVKMTRLSCHRSRSNELRLARACWPTIWQFVVAAGAAPTNRELVTDESAATFGEDRRTAGEAWALLLAFSWRKDIRTGGSSERCWAGWRCCRYRRGSRRWSSSCPSGPQRVELG